MDAFLYPLCKPKAIVSSLNCAMSVGVLTLLAWDMAPRHRKNRVCSILRAVGPYRATFTRTIDYLYWTQYGGWPVSLSTLYLRFRSIGSPYPGVSNGVLYTSCFCLARTHRKRGDDPVRGLFVSGRGSQSASPGQRRLSGDAPLYTSD